jgi:small conductance mechanosensitive channel
MPADCGNDYACELVRKIGLTGFWGRTVEFLLDRPLKIVFILLVSAIVARILGRLARRTVEALAGAPPLRRTSGRADQRIRTLAGVSGSVVRVLVWTVATLIALDQLGLNLGPLIAGASIVGVALGFGAQSLVRDFLSGFFILVEDQYGVGDRVTVAGSEGTVEDVNLRVTRLRAPDGAVWFVPNGEIRKVANTTLGWSRALVDIALAPDADVLKALDVLREEVVAAADDPAIKDTMVEAPQVLGVEEVTFEAITVRVMARAEPRREAEVARLLRARLVARLRGEGFAFGKPTAAPSSAGGDSSSSGE